MWDYLDTLLDGAASEEVLVVEQQDSSISSWIDGGHGGLARKGLGGAKSRDSSGRVTLAVPTDGSRTG